MDPTVDKWLGEDGRNHLADLFVQCQYCRFAESYEVFSMCNNEEAPAYRQPVRNTSSCIFGVKK